MDQPEAMKLQRGHQNGSNHKVNTNVRIDFESNRGGIFKICNIAYKLLLLCKNEPCSTNKQANKQNKILRLPLKKTPPIFLLPYHSYLNKGAHVSILKVS